MKCQAAVLHGVGKQWEVCEIDLDSPQDSEVLVRMAVAGVCHSDDHFATGDNVLSADLAAMMRAAGEDPPEFFPMLGGHEGAGVIEDVGPNVTSVRPGDRVGMSFMPTCGRCRWCATGQSYICDKGAELFATGMTTNGTARRHLGDENLKAMTQLGTFAEYAVVSENSVIKIDDSIPLHAASLVSCGVTTGWGSATVGAGTEPGDTVAVVGVGGVGMNAVQGARAAGAKHIFAIDPVVAKRDWAMSFGATHTSASIYESMEPIRDLTRGVMADRVVLTAGVVHPDLVFQGLMLLRKGGTCVLTGLTPLSEMMVPLVLSDMVNSCKQLKGLMYGGMNPRASMPMLLSMYQNGALKLDELVTAHYRLDQINDAITDMREGRNIRGVIDFH